MKKQKFIMEGNNGGDYIKLIQIDKDRLSLEIGNCCVIVFNHIIPVEFLTNVLTEVGMRTAKTVENDIAISLMEEYCGHKPDYKNKLIKQIQPLDFMGNPVQKIS